MNQDTDRQAVIEHIVEAIKEGYSPQRVILFGSCVSGKTHQDSDIDLLIVKDTDRPFFQRLAEVRRLVSNARKGYPFEPIVITQKELQQRLENGDQFLGQIVAEGRILYAQK